LLIDPEDVNDSIIANPEVCVPCVKMAFCSMDHAFKLLPFSFGGIDEDSESKVQGWEKRESKQTFSTFS
jgi:hypothetical protein